MRGDTSSENGVDGEDCGTSESTSASERRPSLVALQKMLRKVSQSPFHDQYKTLVSSTSDSSASSTNDSQNKQDGEIPSAVSAAAANVTDSHKIQNGLNGDSTRNNPLYNYYLESRSNDDAVKHAAKETSEDSYLDALFAPPPEFQSTPLDVKPKNKTMDNGDHLSEPQEDHFQTLTHNPMDDLFQTSSVGQNTSARGHFHDVTLNSPDLFKTKPARSQNLFKTLLSTNSDLSKDEVDGLFQTAKGEDLVHAGNAKDVNLFDESPSNVVDPFPSPSDMVDDVFQSPQPTIANPFPTARRIREDPFQAVPTNSQEPFHFKEKAQDPSSTEKDNFDMFDKENQTLSSTNTFDPFPSPTRGDLFQDVSSLHDPFGTTPSKEYDPFQDVSNGTSDIFQPLPSTTNSKDIVAVTSNTTAYSTLSLNSSSEMMLDGQHSPDVLKTTPSESLNGLNHIILTTPEGTTHDILQPTPFTRSRNLAMSTKRSPSEMSRMPTIKRPPKPLPRTKSPRTEKPPVPEKPPKPETPSTLPKPIEPEASVPKLSPKAFRLPKPVISRKPKSLGMKPVKPQNYVVFEDILLTGQERCVEDWPEDSPELTPGFKPPGKFRLRRESMLLKTDPEGESGEDQGVSRSQSKKKVRNFRNSLMSRGVSKEKSDDDTKEGKSSPRSLRYKSPKNYFSEPHVSAGEDGEQDGMDYKKPHKTKVSLLRRGSSTPSSVVDRKHMNGYLPQESKGKVVDNSSGEEEATRSERKKKIKIKFVPQRGFTFTTEKYGDEPKGAHGYTPDKGSKDDGFDDVEEMKGYSLQSSSKASFIDEDFQKTPRFSPGLNGEGDEDSKSKKQKNKKLPFIHRSFKEDILDDNSRWKKNNFSAEELDDDELFAMKRKSDKHRGPRKSKTSDNTTGQDDFAEGDITRNNFLKSGEMYDNEQDQPEAHKQKKSSKFKGLKLHKAKSKSLYLEGEDPPGATSSEFLSEAAKAEWLAAQKDEKAIAGSEDEEEEGDTDSLMEWWNTVEQWDEVPSDEEDKVMKEDESKSFTILADKVQRGLRVFNKVFTERAEVLWQSIVTLHTMAEDISNFHHKARIAGITGGTTTAVGGVTAIAGLALAPFTFGTSLIITAVGVGVAAAGGITSASAAISDNVNNMHDRKRVETVLQEYEHHLLAIGKILHFVNQGLMKLRGHPFLRSGTQHYSEDWEIRKAVQMISLVDLPVLRATEVADNALASVQGLFKGTDKYFIKESGELKKGCKKEIVALIKEVASELNEAVMELNTIREDLQDATGDM